MAMSEHFFYVLECQDGSYYAGYTNNLERRLHVHNEGKGAKYTRGRLPVHYVYYQAYETKRQAMQMEYRFKKLNRAQKEQYIRKERSE
ncbi:GIY-YIG nuclease family protein [Sporosarcina sp. PTS2304]|uniref:GIY-YIG nuclease family protein n=1 Tax=Sporosarcina sp. PTS2304 TaxID=2283194 RepID=UPI000E0D1951|nr:GIY-YIG nuclease family protein [Sporosarcina sp. PTS2304]AXI00711.1 GIY-YIG nuclease family protein [Sporosarcina sp. PTS2304]